MTLVADLPEFPPGRAVLIAGPTASGKSALALQIAQDRGGVIVNADASQVYDCWRVVTARPTVADEARASHHLYGHVHWDAEYSVGHWLRDATALIGGIADRVIVVGGTGLNFTALTQGLADIPPTPPNVRQTADDMTLDQLRKALDTRTAQGIDMANRARVQRAWEVLTATGRGLADWQEDTPPPALPLAETVPIVLDTPKDWLEDRITRRFDAMLKDGAMSEVAAMADRFDPALPSCRAIGVPELMAHLRGQSSLDQARERATIATRQFAKRQRTWFRSKMRDWHRVNPAT